VHPTYIPPYNNKRAPHQVEPRPLRFTKEQHKWLNGSGPEVEAGWRRGACWQLQREFNEELWWSKDADGQLVRSCSIVIGMHPGILFKTIT
jgi:hypothetical protein